MLDQLNSLFFPQSLRCAAFRISFWGVPTDRKYKTALRLEYFGLAYNIAEAVLSIFFGGVAGSIALIGFGLDSIVESLSGIILIWRLRQHGRISEEAEKRIERRAMRFVAATFFVLAAYIMYQSIYKLVSGVPPDSSLPGMAIATASLVIMPLLAYKKQILGRQIESKALIADSKETLACAALSFALLAGLAANYFFGLWKADPAVGLIIVLFLIREGWEGWNDAYLEDE